MSTYRNTYFSSPEAEAKAWDLASTPTARRLLSGEEMWSLSSLKGKARQYGGSYARSRNRFLSALTAAGLQPVTLYVGPQRRRVVVI